MALKKKVVKKAAAKAEEKSAPVKKKVAPKKDAAPKTPKVKKPSYQSKIIDFMNANNGVGTREALMEATGADARNLSVAVSILKNGKRTKEPMEIKYLRSAGTFYAMPMAEKAYEAAVQVALDAKKAKKSEKKLEKKAADTE